ncbi:hypothetical protein EPYR_02261 [Erwinia pyrifoliae DSM 12163]|nr:hypothetical protein EPYR_02261 [Erwinia pyrifoliae DSM 12163]
MFRQQLKNSPKYVKTNCIEPPCRPVEHHLLKT